MRPETEREPAGVAAHAATSAALPSDDRSAQSPSRARVSPLFILLAIVLACADNFADPDLWNHILNGLVILRTGHIHANDIYSYSAAGLPWRNHEWLAQVALALAYRSLGIFGLKMLKLACAAIAVCALAFGLSQTSASTRAQRLVLILTAAALTPQMQFRPQIFSFAMLSVLMAVLATEVYRGRASLWLLIPMFALWANLHGAYTAGIAALGLASAVLTVQDAALSRQPNRGLRLGFVTILCALATLLNPYGIFLWTNVFRSVANPFLHLVVQDWRPLLSGLLSSKTEWVEDLIPLGLFAGFAVSIFIAPSLDDAPLTAIAVLFIAAAFDASRNLALAVIALAIPMTNHLAVAAGPRRAAASNNYSEEPVSGLFSAVAGVAIVALAALGGIFSDRLVTWAPVPAGAVAFMQAHGLYGNILDQFGWGDYLIWHTAPQSRVFMDGRADLVYPDSVLNEYVQFHYGLAGARAVLEKYPNDFVLIAPGTGAYHVVASDPKWKPIFRDSASVLFAPASSPIARAPDTQSELPLQPEYFP